MMLIIVVLLAIRFSNIDTCPIYCQCYSAFDGYHVTCQNAKLYEIPYNLIKFLQKTQHQKLIIDLSSNFLSIIPCDLFQISTIITLILTKNSIEYIPWCFSQSSIQILRLNQNQLRFNQTTILSSSKLYYLDISHNKISTLPRTFFNYIRHLRILILNGELNLFQLNNDQWLRSLTTRNQLKIIICDENFHLPLCLFNYLFQTNKLLSIELNSNIYCDCSFVYLTLKKIHFHYCQIQQQEGKCNLQTSYFIHNYSLINLQNDKYRQICFNEYQFCQNIQLNQNYQLTTNNFNLSLNNNQTKSLLFINNSSIITTTTTIITMISTVTFSKKENITAGAIIPFILVLIIMTIVCLYVILSGRIIKIKNRESIKDFIIEQKKQSNMSTIVTSVNSDKKLARLDESISIENVNMNSNPQKNSYYQRNHSYSDEESELTFYSMNNNNKNSSTSFIQSSMSDIDIASLTSTLNSSLSSETIIISNRNQKRIY
ncbi:unnamed protein product [Rotaria sp. Silwood1]|nr:unnamed protein product [Rotaria sp. Silwood1]CAF1604449.1 unnamed protein product [Rotaria sp. Silwood1]CAF3831316.1 unnamed protein product [Rotaria sp. Silwood1]